MNYGGNADTTKEWTKQKWSRQWLEGNEACGSIIEVKANVLTIKPKSNAVDAFQCGVFACGTSRAGSISYAHEQMCELWICVHNRTYSVTAVSIEEYCPERHIQSDGCRGVDLETRIYARTT